MKVADGIEVLLSGKAGFSLSDPLDCTAYAFKSSEGYIVFDCGVGRDHKAVASRLSVLGRPVAAAFITHAHADHSGGAAILKKLTGARLHAGPATARIVSEADERAMNLDVAKRAGVYPSDYRFLACPIDRVVEDNAVVRIGDLAITAVATPGHSADHISYLVESDDCRALVAGDALFDGGRVALQDTTDCSVSDTCATIRKLAAIKFDMFLPGHGPISATGGMRHVELAHERVARLLIPELFI